MCRGLDQGQRGLSEVKKVWMMSPLVAVPPFYALQQLGLAVVDTGSSGGGAELQRCEQTVDKDAL